MEILIYALAYLQYLVIPFKTVTTVINKSRLKDCFTDFTECFETSIVTKFPDLSGEMLCVLGSIVCGAQVSVLLILYVVPTTYN